MAVIDDAGGGFTVVARGTAESPPDVPLEPGYRYRIAIGASVPVPIRGWLADRIRDVAGRFGRNVVALVDDGGIAVELDV